MHSRKLVSILLSLILLFLLTGCGQQKPQEVSGKFAIIYYDFSDGYIYDLSTSIDAVLSDAAVDFINYDSKNDVEVQLAQVEEAISSGVSVIAVNIVDTASPENAEKIVSMASDADVSVIFFDRPVDPAVIHSYEKCAYIGFDLTEECHNEGAMISGYLFDNFDAVDVDDDGIIRYIAFIDQADAETTALKDINTALASAGLDDLLFYDDSSNFSFLSSNNHWNSDNVKAKMDAILDDLGEQAADKVELVYTDNAAAAIGAAKSLNAHHLTVPLFTIGSSDDIMELIQKNHIYGTIAADIDLLATSITAVATNVIAGSSFFTDVSVGDPLDTQMLILPSRCILS